MMSGDANGATNSSGPVVGVVVAAYNAERFLEATLGSVVDQTFRDWTCVVVDDGSADRTPEVASAFAALDSRFVVVVRPNGGPCIARNFGFSALPRDVEYVTFMDADDVWMPDALERLLHAASSTPGVIGAHGLGEFIDESGRPMSPGAFSSLGRGRIGCRGGRPRPWPVERPTTFENLVVQSVVFPPGLVLAEASAYRTVGLFDPRARLAEDLDILVRLSRLGPLAFLDEVVLGYRRHGSNVGAGSGVAEAVGRVRRRTYFSAENSSAERRLVRDAWRAAQMIDARNRCIAAARDLRRGRLDKCLGSMARLPLFAVRYARGRPRRPRRGE